MTCGKARGRGNISGRRRQKTQNWWLRRDWSSLAHKSPCHLATLLLGLILSLTCLPLCRFQKGGENSRASLTDASAAGQFFVFPVWQMCWWNVNFILHPKVVIKASYLLFFWEECWLKCNLLFNSGPIQKTNTLHVYKLKIMARGWWKTFSFWWKYRKYWCHNFAYVTCVTNLLYGLSSTGNQ